jgi:hypothetical protein
VSRPWESGKLGHNLVLDTGEWHWFISRVIQCLLSRLSKKVVKLSRDKAGSSTTSTELPVLDLACTAERRLNRERPSAPRDSNILCMWSLTKVVMRSKSECVQSPPTRHVSTFAYFSFPRDTHLLHSTPDKNKYCKIDPLNTPSIKGYFTSTVQKDRHPQSSVDVSR